MTTTSAERMHNKLAKDDGPVRRPDGPSPYDADEEITEDPEEKDSTSTTDPQDKGTNDRKLYLVVGAGLIAGVMAAPLAPLALGLFGFSSTGVVAGTVAAGIQSSIGNVAAGSLFATAQSVAMGGAFPATGSMIASGVGSVAAYFAIPGGKKKP